MDLEDQIAEFIANVRKQSPHIKYVEQCLVDYAGRIFFYGPDVVLAADLALDSIDGEPYITVSMTLYENSMCLA